MEAAFVMDFWGGNVGPDGGEEGFADAWSFRDGTENQGVVQRVQEPCMVEGAGGPPPLRETPPLMMNGCGGAR